MNSLRPGIGASRDGFAGAETEQLTNSQTLRRAPDGDPITGSCTDGRRTQTRTTEHRAGKGPRVSRPVLDRRKMSRPPVAGSVRCALLPRRSGLVWRLAQCLLRYIKDVFRQSRRRPDQLLSHLEGRVDDLTTGPVVAAQMGKDAVDGVKEIPDGFERCVLGMLDRVDETGSAVSVRFSWTHRVPFCTVVPDWQGRPGKTRGFRPVAACEWTITLHAGRIDRTHEYSDLPRLAPASSQPARLGYLPPLTTGSGVGRVDSPAREGAGFGGPESAMRFTR